MKTLRIPCNTKGKKEVPYGNLDGDTVELSIPVKDKYKRLSDHVPLVVEISK